MPVKPNNHERKPGASKKRKVVQANCNIVMALHNALPTVEAMIAFGEGGKLGIHLTEVQEAMGNAWSYLNDPSVVAT